MLAAVKARSLASFGGRMTKRVLAEDGCLPSIFYYGTAFGRGVFVLGAVLGFQRLRGCALS